jgi:hypothetical protein
MIWQKYFKDKKILFLNDRHEEIDTDKEDRRKLYDKRILPLLKKNDFAVFGEKIDSFLLDYYQSFGLAEIRQKNIFYEDSYLNYISLTEAILHNEKLVKKLKEKNFDIIIPYIESRNTEILAKKIKSSLLRNAQFTDWINNKNNYRQVVKELELPEIPGFRTNKQNVNKYFRELRNQGFRKIVLKRERSVSGFGVFIIKSKIDFYQCLENNFKEKENFVIEGFVENVRYSPNFQYFITSSDIKLIAATDQLLAEDIVSYSGNVYPSTLSIKPEIFKKISQFSQKICLYLQKNKCFGIVGIDYIITKKNEIYSTEANVRFNGSTYPALIIQKLFGENNNLFWLFKTFHFKQLVSFEKLFNQYDYFLKPGKDSGIFPVGVDLLESMGEGQFMIIAESSGKLYDLYKKFK